MISTVTDHHFNEKPQVNILSCFFEIMLFIFQKVPDCFSTTQNAHFIKIRVYCHWVEK